MVRTKEENQKIKEALEQIAEWCKGIALKVPVEIPNVMHTRFRIYKISVTQNYGIGACGDGRYDCWLHIGEKGYQLEGSEVGAYIVENWKNIKGRIISAVEDRKKRTESIMNFEL